MSRLATDIESLSRKPEFTEELAEILDSEDRTVQRPACRSARKILLYSLMSRRFALINLWTRSVLDVCTRRPPRLIFSAFFDLISARFSRIAASLQISIDTAFLGRCIEIFDLTLSPKTSLTRVEILIFERILAFSCSRRILFLSVSLLHFLSLLSLAFSSLTSNAINFSSTIFCFCLRSSICCFIIIKTTLGHTLLGFSETEFFRISYTSHWCY